MSVQCIGIRIAQKLVQFPVLDFEEKTFSYYHNLRIRHNTSYYILIILNSDPLNLSPPDHDALPRIKDTR